MNQQKIGLLGNGGQADEIESYLSGEQEVIFRAVTSEYVDKTNSQIIDIENNNYQDCYVVAAVGAPGLRKELVGKWQGTNFTSIIQTKAAVDKNATIGEGTIIAPGVTVTTNALIGKHVIININASINHDCHIGNFSTIGPGARIAGKVTIGEGVFIGIGATISNGVKIANGCVVGAGAVVIDDITEENSVVVGVPAKTIKINKTWLHEI